MSKKVILVLLALFVFCTGLGYCESSEWKLVVRVDGTVQSQKYQQSAWDNIWQSKMLKDGDKARTLNDSRAKIRLADQTVITVGENTVVEVSQFKLTPKSRTAKIDLLMGKIRVKVAKFFGKESKFEVTTPTAVLAARGTDFYVSESSKNEQAGLVSQAIAPSMTLMVFEGNVNANIGGQNFSVPAGQMLTAAVGGVMINPIPQVSAPGPTVAATGGGQQQQGQGEQQGQQGQGQQGSDMTGQQGAGQHGPGAGTPGQGGPPPRIDVDLTMAGYGATPPAGGAYYVTGGVSARPPTTGTLAPTAGGVNTPAGPPPIYNPSNQDTGSLPVTVQ